LATELPLSVQLGASRWEGGWLEHAKVWACSGMCVRLACACVCLYVFIHAWEVHGKQNTLMKVYALVQIATHIMHTHIHNRHPKFQHENNVHIHRLMHT